MRASSYEPYIMDQQGVLHRVKTDTALHDMGDAYNAIRSAAFVQRVLADKTQKSDEYRFYLGLIFTEGDLIDDGETWDPDRMVPVETVDLMSPGLLN